MRVLHINQAEMTGGAAIGVHRLHQGLLLQGIDSRFIVEFVDTGSDRVAPIPPRHSIDWQIFRLTRRLGFNEIHLTSTFEIAKHPFYQAADVLHLHNLHNGYFNYLALPKLTKDKPAILTLHDMWGMTGHCAYSFDCDRWKTGCGNCPDLKTDPGIQRDSTYIQWKLKNWAYQHSNLIAVTTTSRWMVEQIKQSMLGHLPVHQIPYGIDTEAYRPIDQQQCRAILGVSSYRYVLMCAAQALDNPRKGGDLLIEGLNKLPESLKSETVLLILGKGGDTISRTIDMSAIDLGYVSSDRIKSIAYSAADVFLFPTRVDAFGLVAQEAMACGTPVVAFKVGGVPDLVHSGMTGYLAEPERTEDFSNGIVQLLEGNKQRNDMRQYCRVFTLENYALEIQANHYIQLYKQAS